MLLCMNKIHCIFDTRIKLNAVDARGKNAGTQVLIPKCTALRYIDLRHQLMNGLFQFFGL
ncbi:MAG: hypothetical protein ACJAUP_000631 [Cellvibrionaceae bacterium]|jgi:hypothetical protein